MADLALVYVARDRFRVVNLDDVFLLEADGGDTLVYRHGSAPLRDTRALGPLLDAWRAHPLLRIHDSYAVHPARVFEIRLRDEGRDWELKLEPPLNKVLPISRRYTDGVWEAFGHDGKARG